MTDAAERQPISVTKDDDDADSIELVVTDNVTATIIIEDPCWHDLFKQTQNTDLTNVMQQAFMRADSLSSPMGFTILLTDDERMAILNRQFRDKDISTNVLSFPDQQDDHYLGDIAIGYDIMVAEAEAAQMPLADHFFHLLVHGILHLIGFDHLDDAEANIMETEEKLILATIGIADPYECRGVS